MTAGRIACMVGKEGEGEIRNDHAQAFQIIYIFQKKTKVTVTPLKYYSLQRALVPRLQFEASRFDWKAGSKTPFSVNQSGCLPIRQNCFHVIQQQLHHSLEEGRRYPVIDLIPVQTAIICYDRTDKIQ